MNEPSLIQALAASQLLLELRQARAIKSGYRDGRNYGRALVRIHPCGKAAIVGGAS